MLKKITVYKLVSFCGTKSHTFVTKKQAEDTKKILEAFGLEVAMERIVKTVEI